MNKSQLYIYNFSELFEILKELEDHISFHIKHIEEKKDMIYFENLELSDCVVLSLNNLKIPQKDSVLIIEKLPIKFEDLIQKINIFSLKKNFLNKSHQLIKDYRLDTNARELTKNDIKIKLTQKETEIILFLSNIDNDKSINNIQRKVWGHNSKLETHTVETHIYRLRRKILHSFKDSDFILSTDYGYKI